MPEHSCSPATCSRGNRGLDLQATWGSAVHGLLYGYAFDADGLVHELGWDEIEAALARTDRILWLHFNYADAEARRWIEACRRLPDAFRAALLDFDGGRRIERTGEGLIGAISDIHHDFHYDPAQISTLRFYLDGGCLITTRRHPLATAERMHQAIRNGRHFTTTVELMIELFKLQGDTLDQVSERLGREVADIEDQILAERIRAQRARLSQIRRLAVRLHRQLVPERKSLQRLALRPPDWFRAVEVESLRDVSEDFGEMVDDLDGLQERAKLLQEDLAARVAEATNRNLFLLSVVTAIFLPLTLVTGIFGMNVAGLPGLQDPAAFWWVMGGMLLFALWAILWLQRRRLFN